MDIKSEQATNKELEMRYRAFQFALIFFIFLLLLLGILIWIGPYHTFRLTTLPLLILIGLIMTFGGLVFEIIYLLSTSRSRALALAEKMTNQLAIEKNNLQQEKNKISAILSSIGDAVLVVDREEKIISINGVAEGLCGYHLDEAVGKKYNEIFNFILEKTPDVLYTDFIAEVIKTESIYEMPDHTILISKDGRHIPVADSAAPIHDKDGNVFGCVLVLRDTTHERELEKAKDDFLSVAAHQLRTPLGSMKWSLEMLLNGDFGKINHKFDELFKKLSENNQRMIKLVNDLLNSSRIDQGRVADNPIKVNIEDIVKTVIKELEIETKQKLIKVSIEIKNTLPSIIIDPVRFHEVITNLVSNAIKYNKNKGSITIIIKKQTDDILLSIADTGIGIPYEDQKRLFSKFFRAANAVHSETDGTGLGLFVVKSYIESWGGKICLKSREDHNTCFTINLPLSPSQHNIDRNLALNPHQTN